MSVGINFLWDSNVSVTVGTGYHPTPLELTCPTSTFLYGEKVHLTRRRVRLTF